MKVVAALGQWVRSQWISHQKVNDETNCIGNEDDDERPGKPIHATSSGISVHITDHAHQECKDCRGHDWEHDPKEPLQTARLKPRYDR